MKYIIYLFYKYYNSSRNTALIAYESALLAVITLLFMNLFAVVHFFNFNNYVFSGLAGKSRRESYLAFLAFFILPVYLCLYFVYRKANVINATYKPDGQKLHGWLLVLYIVFSFFLLVCSINYHR